MGQTSNSWPTQIRWQAPGTSFFTPSPVPNLGTFALGQQCIYPKGLKGQDGPSQTEDRKEEGLKPQRGHSHTHNSFCYREMGLGGGQSMYVKVNRDQSQLPEEHLRRC